MNSAAQAIKVGLFFIFGVALVWVAYETLSESNVGGRETYQVVAAFEDLKTLKASDEVRLAGVQIGNVIETRLENFQAVAVLAIQKQYMMPSDSKATISNAGLLGTNYVSILAGQSPEMLESGSRIETFNTPDINEVVAEIGKVGKRLDGVFDKVETSIDSLSGSFGGLAGGGAEGEGVSPGELFANLNSLIEENRTRISNTLSNFEKLSTDMADGRGTLGKLLSDDAAYDKLLAAADEVGGAARSVQKLSQDANGIFADIKEGKGPLGILLYDEVVAGQIQSTIGNVEGFTAKLNNPNNSIGRLLEDDSLYTQAQDTLNRVDSALGRVDDTGPVTAVGVLATALF